MRNKMKDLLRLEGISVVLDEIQPKYFPYVIKWRNDKQLNKFLNQPEDLTLESQTKWYKEHYLKDDAQGFMVMVDKKTNTPFGTLGWTEMDTEKRKCIMGRLILGNSEFKNAPAFLESFFVLSDYIYSFVDTVYIQLDPNNKKACRLNKRFGFVPNKGIIQYPQALIVDSKPDCKQVEHYRTREMYEAVRKKLYEDIQEELFSEYR